MGVTRGLIAGAAGTVTLNVVTYLDMAVRGRPASSVPASTVEKAADAAGVRLAAEGRDDTAKIRSQGLGAILGHVSGLGFGALYGTIRSHTGALPTPAAALGLTLAAMTGATVPSVALGVTDPREWGVEGWLGDLVPHLAYGFVTAGVYDAIQ